MRPRFLIVLTVAVLVMLGLLLWLRPAKPPVASTPAPVSAAQSSVPPTSQPPANQPAIAAQLSATPASPLAAGGAATVSNNAVQTRELEMKQDVEGKNVPVRFYGMVIDQDSNALAGVSVTLSVRHNVYVTPGSLEAMKYAAFSHDELQKVLSPSIQVTTDAAGRFQWDDAGVTGDVLGVGSITKDGYEAEPGQYSCGAGSGSYDNPVIFKMWSTNIHEQLITGEKKFPIVPDGRSYVIDLNKGTIAESGAGDLKVWVKYPSQVTRGQLYDWSAEIDVINGGLLEEPLGSVMYSAPADGYVPSFQLRQQIKGGQSGETGSRQFYVRLNNGQEYGRITIDLYAPYNDQYPGLIRLSYAINPSGSRILR